MVPVKEIVTRTASSQTDTTAGEEPWQLSPGKMPQLTGKYAPALRRGIHIIFINDRGEAVSHRHCRVNLDYVSPIGFRGSRKNLGYVNTRGVIFSLYGSFSSSHAVCVGDALWCVGAVQGCELLLLVLHHPSCGIVRQQRGVNRRRT